MRPAIADWRRTATVAAVTEQIDQATAAERADLPMTVANAQTRELLELPAVLERVARFASFSAARAEALALRPVADRATGSARLEATDEDSQLLEGGPSFSVGAARDVRDRAERAARGARLEPADLLDGHDHLRATRLAVARR